MKILVVTNLYPPQFVGGYELGCAQMVAELRGRGHQVRVISSVGPAGQDTDTQRVLQMAEIYQREYLEAVSPAVASQERLRGLGVDATNVGILAREIETFAPDVAYLWNTLGLGPFGILALLGQMDVPWVWHLMDQLPAHMCHFTNRPNVIGQQFARLFPGRYVCCSSHVVAEISAAGVELGDRIEFVSNWVSDQPPGPRPAPSADGALKPVSASGSLSQAKGTDILLDTAELLLEQDIRGFSIDLFGQHDDPRYAARIRIGGLDGHVRLLGPVAHDELLSRFSSYDVFAFPTWSREPAAFAPLEAAAAGCVPLLTDDCGNAEWLIDGVDCLKAPRRADAFAAAITAILSGETDLAALSRRCRRVVADHFSLSRAAAKVELSLAAAAAEPRQRRPATSAECYTLARLAHAITQTLLGPVAGP